MVIDQSISRFFYQFLAGFHNLVQPNFVTAASPFVFFLFPFCRSFCWWANQTILLRLVHDCNDTTMYCQTIHSLSIIFFFTYASVGNKVILKKSCNWTLFSFQILWEGHKTWINLPFLWTLFRNIQSERLIQIFVVFPEYLHFLTL